MVWKLRFNGLSKLSKYARNISKMDTFLRMEKISLASPSEVHEQAAREYLQEHIDNGEPHLHGASLFEIYNTYSEWLAHLKANSDPKTLEPGWGVSSTFFGIRENDGRNIGMIDIRHELNDFLRNYGGNIGYGVRPSERRKGYATQMLSLALEYCRKLDYLKLWSHATKTIRLLATQSCMPAVFWKRIVQEDGSTVQIFWIT
jgi:predicted acetyltransferase